MKPTVPQVLLVVAALVCFAAAYFLEEQRTILVAAGIGAIALLVNPEKVGISRKKSTLLALLFAGSMGMGQTGCTPAATQAVVSAASSVLSEILLRSQQSSEVLDMVESRVDGLPLSPDVVARIRTGIAACRAANAAALAAAQGAEQTAASANAAFEPFRKEWSALAQILEQAGVLGGDGKFKVEPGAVAIPAPLALAPFE